jgi:hypothetical protein
MEENEIIVEFSLEQLVTKQKAMHRREDNITVDLKQKSVAHDGVCELRLLSYFIPSVSITFRSLSDVEENAAVGVLY